MNNRLKLLIAVILTVTMLCLNGCGSYGESGGSSSSAASSSAPSQTSFSKSATSQSSLLKGRTFALPYNTVVGFNPLLPASVSNQSLWPLMYDCLAEPGTDFEPVLRLASSINNTGTTVTVALKSGVIFTDGSSLTADDVVYSLNYAKNNPQSPYNSRLAGVVSVSASQQLTVTLTLKNPDPMFANMLDIPIIKARSDVGGDAIGTGRFIYKHSGVNAVLTFNSHWYNAAQATPAIKKINLINVPRADAVMSTLSIGDVNYVYSDTGGSASAAAIGTGTAAVGLNRMAFIGVNNLKVPLNSAHFRKALSLSINRGQLVMQNFSGRAVASAMPFNPAFSKLPSGSNNTQADYSAAASEITAAGVQSGTTFTLLVNSENTVRVAAAKYIAACLGKSGITVNVSAVPFATYQSTLASGSFDLYLGETELGGDMDISPLLYGGSIAYGASQYSTTLTAYSKWKNGAADFKSVVSAFSDDMPFIPICFKQGAVSYTKGLTGMSPTDGDIFFGFEKFKY